MTRLVGFVALALVILISTGISAGKATKTVSEVTPTQSIRLAWIGKRTEPTIVKSRDDLAGIIPNRLDDAKVSEQIDFGTHNLMIFAWKGDAQDRINVQVRDAKVEFVHWGNAPGDDPHLHCYMFAVQKGVEFSATIEPDPR